MVVEIAGWRSCISCYAYNKVTCSRLPHLTADLKAQEILKSKDNVEIKLNAKVNKFADEFNIGWVEITKKGELKLLKPMGIWICRFNTSNRYG